MKKALMLVPCLFFTLLSIAQDKKELKVKYGKLSEEEIKMTAYDKDPNAPAVVLFDKCYASYGSIRTYERHIRIKIFKKEAYDKANFRILFSRKFKENPDIKGICFNSEEGKLTETKVTGDNIKEESLNKYLDVKKVTVPGVREGSIIDLKYTIYDPGLYDWYFQDDIPTIWSEYEMQIPAFYVFTKVGQGTTPYFVNTLDKKSENWDGSNATYVMHNYRWVQKDVPAIKFEKYMTSIEDYRTKLAFNLEAIQFPNQTTIQIMRSWSETAKMVMDDADFGDFIDRKGALSEELATVVKTTMTPIEKVQAIYEYVGKHYDPKGSYSIWLTSTLQQLKEKRNVSTGEMNLVFLNMLKTAGINAAPVILRTRDDGHVATTLAALRRFNSVIAHVKIDKDTFFVDASGYPAPLKLLPINVLSGYGVEFLGKKEYDIVIPQSKINTRRFAKATLMLNTEGSLSGDINLTFSGYDAVENRNLIRAHGVDKVIPDMVKDLIGDGKLLEKKIENEVTLTDAPLKASLKITSTAYVTKNDDKMFISPILCFGEKNNPFKTEERQYDVDFGAPKEAFYQLSLTLPEGYTVEELPKTSRLQMPENGMKFDYLIDVKGNILSINTKLNIKQVNYTPDEYALLKQFYAQMLAKMGEQIVLTKVK